jgi:hypothetical protein
MPTRTLCALALVIGLGGCTLPTGCPQTIEAARTADLGDDMFVGGGVVIRFVPSPDPEYRGYDVNITRPISPANFLNTAFLRVVTELPGIEAGDPVLLIGPRERGALVLPGACPPLTVVGEDELEQ